MADDKKIYIEKNQIGELLQFVTLLESEGEEGLTSIVAETQTLEEKLRAIEFALKEKKDTVDENLFFFSPIGVLEEKEENRELQTKKTELETTLRELNKKLNEYKFRKGKLEAIRSVLLEKEEQIKQQEKAEKIAADRKAEEEKTVASNEKPNAVTVEEKKPDAAAGGEKKASDELSKDGENVILTNRWSILETQENVRNRIAADLHDSTVQAMTSLVHKTEFCLLLMNSDPVRVRLELQKIIDTLKVIINETRDLIFNLRPMHLNKNDLSATIETYCLQVQKTRSVTVETEIKGKEPELLSVWKLTLYRIFQEAVENSVRHANATKIDVSLSFEENQACMVVKDNGKGFDTELLKKAEQEEYRHFGISLMKERVYLLNGRIDLKSDIGKGTVVEIVVPYQVRKELLNESD